MATPAATLASQLPAPQTVEVMTIPQNVLDAVTNSGLGCMTMSELADMLWNGDQRVKDVLELAKPVIPHAAIVD